MDQIGILLGFTSLLVTIVIAVIGFYKRDSIRNWLSGNRFPEIGGAVKDASEWDAIIFTVSRSSTPKWVIDTASPAMTGIVGSASNQVFLDSMNEVESYAESKGCEVVGVEKINDSSDVSEVKNKVKSLIDIAIKKGAQHIAVDLTGGTAPMSLGAFMAAEEAKITSLYVSMDFNEFKPIYSSAKLLKISQHDSE